jgi:hypothetical protein
LGPAAEDIADRYRRFAVEEAGGKSPLYEELSSGVAGDPRLIHFLQELPGAKQQPNLLFAAYRHVLGVPQSFADFRAGLLQHSDAVRQVMMERSTQTNEPNRCAALLPILASLHQPLALLEVGASAGLCLFPDRYGYDYPAKSLRPSHGTAPYPVFPCSTSGFAPPDVLPKIVWRAGLDLNPLRADDPEEVAWLQTLVWPEQQQRRDRLRLALDIAAADPPTIIRGDLLGPEFEALCRQAPPEATLVVFHTAVLAYVLHPQDRMDFAERAEALADVWVCNESPGATPLGDKALPIAPIPGAFLLSVNRSPVAWTDPHGAWLEAIPVQ